jgi:hypothetical protein
MNTVINVTPRGPYYSMWSWCIDHFGREALSKYFAYDTDRWLFEDYFDYGDGFHAIFRDIEDATWFSLVWL